MPLLQMNGIGKSFPGVRALDHVSFDLNAGEVHALMGENGAGKSTLMKVLAGAYAADEGEVLIDGSKASIDSPARAAQLGISIIYQEFNLIPQLSVAENIFLGREPHGRFGKVNFASMTAEAQKIMDRLGAGIDVGTPVSRLSVALQQMVEIGKAVGRNARILVMDEPSASLTDHELAKLYDLIGELRAEGVAIIYISHRMNEVFAICDRITVLRDGRTMGTVTTREATPAQLIRMMVGRTLDEAFPKVSSPKGEPVLRVTGLTRHGVLHDIHLQVREGEVVALAGLVGSGRTEVARCIFGADSFDSGEIEIAGNPLAASGPADAIASGIGLVSEDRKGEGLVLGMSVRENSSLAALHQLARSGVVDRKKESTQVLDYVDRLGVKTPSLEQTVRNLSGGNQQKVVLSKWLLTRPKLLILDEPTRGIDVGAKIEIYNLINQLTSSGIGILMISSELPEVLGMADRIIVMRDGRIVGELSREEATQEKIGELAVGMPVREA